MNYSIGDIVSSHEKCTVWFTNAADVGRAWLTNWTQIDDK